MQEVQRFGVGYGRTVIAPLPGGIVWHFGPELRRSALLRHLGR